MSRKKKETQEEANARVGRKMFEAEGVSERRWRSNELCKCGHKYVEHAYISQACLHLSCPCGRFEGEQP